MRWGEEVRERSEVVVKEKVERERVWREKEIAGWRR